MTRLTVCIPRGKEKEHLITVCLPRRVVIRLGVVRLTWTIRNVPQP
jgi:hypothetical protein